MQVEPSFMLVLVQVDFGASRFWCTWVSLQAGFVASRCKLGAKQTLASALESFLGTGAAAGADQRAHFGC